MNWRITKTLLLNGEEKEVVQIKIKEKVRVARVKIKTSRYF